MTSPSLYRDSQENWDRRVARQEARRRVLHIALYVTLTALVIADMSSVSLPESDRMPPP